MSEINGGKHAFIEEHNSMIVSVVYGGTPEEKGPSEKNAKDIAKALENRGHEVHLLQIGKDIINAILSVKTEVVYLCVQGKGYGDGTFQAMLEMQGIPFTGSHMRAACLINDKILSKLVFDRYGIRTPKWDILTKKQFEKGDYPYEDFGYPFVAKAPTQGGSFGIELIRSREDIPRIGSVFKYDDPILLEKFIPGGFYTVGIYKSKKSLVSLPVVEGLDLDKKANADDGLITFTGNYGIRESKLNQNVTEEIKHLAMEVYHATGAKDLCRVDFMVSEEDSKPYVLEINAVPGLKRYSLMPKAAELAGIVYEDMIEDILYAALDNNAE